MGWRSKTSILAGSALLAVTLIYALAASMGLPWLVRRGIADWQARVPGLQVTLSSLSCNPLTLNVTAQQLVIRHAGHELLAVGRIQIIPSSRSLAERSLVVREVALQNLFADVRWDANGHLDIEQILPRDTGANGGGRLGWRIDHLSLDALRMRVAATGTLAEPIDVTVPRLELDHLDSRDPGGRFAFDVHGSNSGQRVWDLHWQGRLDVAPVASTGHIRLSALSLPWVSQTLGNRWPLKVRHGQADVEGDYSFADVDGRRQLVLEHTTLEIRGFDARGAGRIAPEVSLRRLSVRTLRIDSLQHRVIGESIALESPEVLMHLQPNGELDLQRLIHEWPAASASAARPPTPAWSVTWPLAEVRDAVVRLADGAGGWRLPGVNLRIANFQSAGTTALQWAAHGAGLSRGEGRATGAWSVEGRLQSASAALQVRWRLQDLDLRLLNALPRWPSMLEVTSGELTARGGIDGSLHHPARWLATVEGGLRQVALRSAAAGAWSAARVTLAPVRLLPASGRGGPVRFTAPALRVSTLSWDVQRAALHLRGAARGVTLLGTSWDGARRRAALRVVSAAAGHGDLLGGARNLHLGWRAVKVEGINADLAAQRYSAGTVTGTDWRWRGRLPWISLATFELAQVRGSLPQRRIALGKVQVGGGQVLLAQTRTGAIEPLAELDSLRSVSTGQSEPAPVIGGAAPAMSPWRLNVGGAQVRLDSLRLGPGLAPPPARRLGQLVLRTDQWSSTAKQPLRTHFEFTLGAGQWRWDGDFTPQPLALDGQLVVQHLDLPPLAVLMMRGRDARIDRGSVSLSGRVGVHRQRDIYAWHYAGSLAVMDGRIVDGERQVLASWAAASMPMLTADGQSGLNVPRLDLDGLLAQIRIFADHRINLESMLQGQGRSPARSSSSARVSTPWPVRIDLFQLARGRLDFEDETLATPFHAAIHDLAGTVGLFANDAARAPAHIQLSGRVNDYGRVDVEGSLTPLQRPQDGDVRVHFSRIELPTLNPYAAQIAGYRVDQGMLDLRLHYTLDNGLIEGDNRARIDQLILGPQVRSGAAPDLPLRAIIDILRNDQGEIDLDVPVRGNLNDPDFVLSDVAVKALQDALRKTLESPFELLANLLGRDSEQLRHIDFRAHMASLNAEDEEKLRNIGSALANHGRLLVFIRPTYDRLADGSGPPRAATAAAHGNLRTLALQRGEAIKKALVQSGVSERRILIDEPEDLPQTSAGMVRTGLELKAP